MAVLVHLLINWDTHDDDLQYLNVPLIYQHIIKSTHFRPNKIRTFNGPSIFTNEEDMVTNLAYLPLGNSDHVCLRFDFIIDNKYTRS